MRRFVTTQDAKEFLVSRIITEAQREGISLSEVERKMLYFSETAWALPDIAEANDAFDRDYDQAAYEEKIGKLVRNFCDDARKNNRQDLDAWKDAVDAIHSEDHYVLVLIAAGGSPGGPGVGLLKLAALGFGLACVIFAIAYLFVRM